jgi:hypothetical protein
MTRVGGWHVQIVYRSAVLDGFAGAHAESIVYGRWGLGRPASSCDQLENFTRFGVGFGDGRANVGFLPFVMPSLLRMHARSSARQLWRSMSAAATAPGYWRTCSSPGDFPSSPSRPSFTYSSSRRTSIKDGDHRSMEVAETAERTARGRTSRRQRFVVAPVGAELRRFWPARGARPGRGDVVTRIADFLSGGFRREGMGTPKLARGRRNYCFTASAIVRCLFTPEIASSPVWP